MKCLPPTSGLNGFNVYVLDDESGLFWGDNFYAFRADDLTSDYRYVFEERPGSYRSTEIRDWCVETLGARRGRWESTHVGTFLRDDNDAVLFKLRWS